MSLALTIRGQAGHSRVPRSMPFLPACLLALLLPAQPGFGGRPLTIDDAAPVEPGKFQLEAGVGFVKDRDVCHFDFPLTLAFGLCPGLEVGAGFGGHFEHRNGIDPETVASAQDTAVGAKWRVIDLEPQAFSLAIAPTVKLPTADEGRGFGSGETDFDVTLIVTQVLGTTAVDVNLGYTLVGEQDQPGHDGVLHYGIAIRQELDPLLWLVGDVFASTPLDTGGATAVGCSLGVQYEVTPGVVLDAAVGTVLTDGPDFMGTVGLTWVF